MRQSTQEQAPLAVTLWRFGLLSLVQLDLVLGGKSATVDQGLASVLNQRLNRYSTAEF